MATAKMNLPFTGVMTFGKLPLWDRQDTAIPDVIFLGAPYDLGSLNRPGSRYGPRSLRDAYTRSKPFFHVEFGRLYLDHVTMADGGDIDMPYPHAGDCLENVRRAVAEVHEAGAVCGLLGGDRSVTVPAVRALSGEKDLFIVSLSAHLDLADDRGTICEATVSHALCALPHVQGMAHIGVHGPTTEEEMAKARHLEHDVWGVRAIRELGVEGLMERLPVEAACYVSIDCSVFDPGVFSASTRPAPGGLSFIEVSDILHAIGLRYDVKGFDVTGYTPFWDREAVSAQIAGRVALDLVATMFPG